MISKYIKELIENNNNRVIIPDFGAFMVQNTPSGKQITFNDFLKFNDGLLINQIIKAEKIGKADALEQIKNFVKEIEKKFADGKPFEIKEIGFLRRDEQKTVKFDSKLVETSKPIKKQTTTIIPDEKKEEKKVVEETKIETKKEETKIPPPIKKTTIPPLKSKPVETKKTTIPNKPLNKKTPVETKTPVAKTKTTEKTVVKEKDNKKLIIIIAAGVVLLLGILALVEYKFSVVGLFGSDDKQVVEQQPVITKPEPVVADTLPEKDTIMEQPVVEEKEPKQVVDPNAKRYYIVAGSFKIKSNAERFNQKLINEGYQSEIIERNIGYYTVTYKTFYNWHNALTEWQNMRVTDSETWIFIQ